jgi:hypothetical protein
MHFLHHSSSGRELYMIDSYRLVSDLEAELDGKSESAQTPITFDEGHSDYVQKFAERSLRGFRFLEWLQ